MDRMELEVPIVEVEVGVEVEVAEDPSWYANARMARLMRSAKPQESQASKTSAQTRVSVVARRPCDFSNPLSVQVWSRSV